MSLLDYWKAVVKENGYDRLSADDQATLRNVYFTGAVACYGAMLSSGHDKAALHAELQEFTDQNRNLRVPPSD